MATPHHQTFDRLVNDQTGFVGRVAYTFYKNDKLAWIRGFHDKEAYQQSDVVKRCENILNGSKKTTWQAVKESLLSSVLSSFIITGLSVLLYLGSVAVFDDFRGLIHRLTAPEPVSATARP